MRSMVDYGIALVITWSDTDEPNEFVAQQAIQFTSKPGKNSPLEAVISMCEVMREEADRIEREAKEKFGG